jgi:hypothetical protein
LYPGYIGSGLLDRVRQWQRQESSFVIMTGPQQRLIFEAAGHIIAQRRPSKRGVSSRRIDRTGIQRRSGWGGLQNRRLAAEAGSGPFL